MLKFRLIGGILMIGALLLSGCGGISNDLAATLTAAPNDISTQAVGTFSAGLTATAFAAPTDTPAPTATPMPTFTPLPTSTGGVAFGTAPVATASCYGLSFVSDVTIPDNTPVDPGKKFTKTWKVKNSGTCAWDAGFKFAFVTGDAMGGETFTLPSSVTAGAVTDISVSMTAPNKAGTIRGDWRMSTAGGQFFGDQVYVQIVVGGGAAATNTGSAATATSTATATATP
jgi:Ig-like domain-containing protein